MPLRAMLANITPRGRIVLAAVALGTVVVLFLLMRMASAPSYATLMTGLDPAQTGRVTASLDERGIGYELQNNGTAIAVDKGRTAEARIALAGAGVDSSSSQPGYELLDRQKLGTSNFQQQVNYQRALEGEISKTIEQVDGVTAAQVQLVLPDRDAQLFADEASPATAAVLLSGATAIDPASVRGVAQLVANSVPGLQIEKVTISDGSGALLWPTGEGAGGGVGGGMLAKQTAQARYDQQMAAALTAMLARTVGPDKAQVQVHADLDANEATREELTYGRRGVPLQSKTEDETLRGGGGTGGGGVAGAGGNAPAYAQTGGGAGNSDYRRRVADETLGVDKTVTRTRIPPGAINRQTVSVLLDRSVPAASIPAIEEAVANAAGIDTRRGDRLSVGQVAFARPPALPAASPVAAAGGYAKYVALAIATIGFLFFLTRQLRRRERETLAGEPTWLSEIEAPRTLAELERLEHSDHPTHVRPLRTPEQPARLQVEDLVDRDPDRVAQQVRAWMAEDDK